MLSPFELLTQFKAADNSDMIGSEFYAKWKQTQAEVDKCSTFQQNAIRLRNEKLKNDFSIEEEQMG